MKFSTAFLDEIRARTRISEIIGRRVQLKTRGRGEFTGLCPFHKEKTPSFTVSDDKGFYHCFGCGVHGDVIRYLVESQGLGFVEAVTQLAEAAGMQLPQFTKEDSERYERIDVEYDALEAAATWFEDQFESDKGAEARAYIEKRGLTAKTIEQFRIGFAPDSSTALRDALLAKGFTLQNLIDTGLVIQKDNGDTYSRFRNRVMFPIMDARGRVIAFGGRIINEGEPKYLNSPETELFKKGYVLYAWHFAKQTAYDKGTIAVVEGYLDVIALHQAGINNVVAPLGTALTENHLRQLWRVANEPVLCMDGDNAGKRAMQRAAENYIPMLAPGYSLKFATLPPGQDPDDFVKADGVDAMRKILSSALPLSFVLWEFETSRSPLDTPEAKADLERRLMKLVGSIRDKSVQTYYQQHFREKLWELGNPGRRGKKSTKTDNKQVRLTSLGSNTGGQETERERYEIIIMKLILNHPDLLHEESAENDLMHMDFAKDSYNKLKDEMLAFAAENPVISTENLVTHLEKSGFNHQIEHIKCCKFIESFARTGVHFETVKSEWRYITTLRSLLATQEEYAAAVKKFQDDITEETQSRILELQKQMDVLKLAIASEKKHREVLLEE